MGGLWRRSDENRVLAKERKIIAQSVTWTQRAAAQRRAEQIASEEESLRAALEEDRKRADRAAAEAETRAAAEAKAWFTSVVEGQSRRMPRLFGWFAILVWCVVAAILVALSAETSLGFVIVIPFVLIAPGATIVLLLQLRRLALIATVVSLTGIAIDVLVPSILLYAGAWSPKAAFATIAGMTFTASAVGVLRDADKVPRLRMVAAKTLSLAAFSRLTAELDARWHASGEEFARALGQEAKRLARHLKATINSAVTTVVAKQDARMNSLEQKLQRALEQVSRHGESARAEKSSDDHVRSVRKGRTSDS